MGMARLFLHDRLLLPSCPFYLNSFLLILHLLSKKMPLIFSCLGRMGVLIDQFNVIHCMESVEGGKYPGGCSTHADFI